MASVKKIPFFNYPALFSSQEHDLMAVLRDVMRRGAYILQKDLADFEANLRNYLKVKHAFGVADGTNALQLALLAKGIGPGDEVIVPAHTYIASAASVHFTGATPVLCECGADHMIDAGVGSGEDHSAHQGHHAGATQRPHRRYGFHHAAGSRASVGRDRGRRAGPWVKVQGPVCRHLRRGRYFQLLPSQVLGCFGDGGAVVTNDDDVAERIALLRDHGRNAEGEVIAWGTNSRLDNIQAAVLNFKLKTFDSDLDRRRTIARAYQAGLRAIKLLSLPPGPDADRNHYDVFQNYEIEAERRDDLQMFLAEQGVRTIVQFGGKAVHQFRGLGFEGVRLPATEQMYTRFLLLPMNTTLSDEDVQYVIECICQFYRN